MKELTYMSRTIDTFRDFYQPDLVRERFELYPAVTQAIALVREDLGSHGIPVETDNDADSFVTGYKHEFSQVILSVICNSKEAIMLRKPAEPYVKITCTQNEEMADVTIRDNGGGIPVEVLDKIFDPYFTTKFMSQGRGLGLYMSRMIIEKHMGGRISVSNCDSGVIVTIRIPLSSAQENCPLSSRC
jgi:C4-dicarboxylate-specific signal transduction histidine kinase